MGVQPEVAIGGIISITFGKETTGITFVIVVSGTVPPRVNAGNDLYIIHVFAGAPSLIKYCDSCNTGAAVLPKTTKV